MLCQLLFFPTVNRFIHTQACSIQQQVSTAPLIAALYAIVNSFFFFLLHVNCYSCYTSCGWWWWNQLPATWILCHLKIAYQTVCNVSSTMRQCACCQYTRWSSHKSPSFPMFAIYVPPTCMSYVRLIYLYIYRYNTYMHTYLY